MTDAAEAPTGRVRVVATAGHVDHGKSSLIVSLTGMDPDRWDEEKRRGLTIDLGFAWCTLPSGREIGFVDVPGHERFITNMLAGVGPVPAVLFVIAADEGWKPQSEEHLEILDVLGVTSGVVALTRCDLVDPAGAAATEEAVRHRLEGSTLADAPIVTVSSTTGEGIGRLASALDDMVEAMAPPGPGRARLFVDRVFTIKGSGTVVTGTVTGGCLTMGEEVQLLPAGTPSRIRSLQTHGKAHDRGCPVSRVAANLAGIDRSGASRGDVLVHRGDWDPTDVFDAVIRPVRGLERSIGSRGAYKVYAGAAEVDARIRFLGSQRQLAPGNEAFVRIRTSRPLILEPFDRVVIRDAGRRQTVAGGIVLDVVPPPRRGGDARTAQLSARAVATRSELPALMADERGAARADIVIRATGGDLRGGAERWILRPGLFTAIAEALTGSLTTYHGEHPLEEGAPLRYARDVVTRSLRAAGAPADPELVAELLARCVREGAIATSTTTVRLVGHRVALDAHDETLDRLLVAIGGERASTPPTIKDLLAAGFDRDVIEAAARAGQVVKISSDLIVTPSVFERAVAIVAPARGGITVSAFREALATSRKYAVPMLEYLDRSGITRREGDLRFPR